MPDPRPQIKGIGGTRIDNDIPLAFRPLDKRTIGKIADCKSIGCREMGQTASQRSPLGLKATVSSGQRWVASLPSAEMAPPGPAQQTSLERKSSSSTVGQDVRWLRVLKRDSSVSMLAWSLRACTSRRADEPQSPFIRDFSMSQVCCHKTISTELPGQDLYLVKQLPKKKK